MYTRVRACAGARASGPARAAQAAARPSPQARAEPLGLSTPAVDARAGVKTMTLTRAERERIHELRKQQAREKEESHKLGHHSRGGF